MIRSETGAPAALMSMYADAPPSAVVAYTSVYECRIRTGLSMSTSRTTPPNVAVNMPHATAAAHGTPARAPFCAPITQNAPTPRASRYSTQGSVTRTPNASSKCGQARNAPAAETAQIHRYSGSSIQNARRPRPRSTSRIVPPPTAVMVPTTVAPSTSMPRAAAASEPVTAKVAVPT